MCQAQQFSQSEDIPAHCVSLVCIGQQDHRAYWGGMCTQLGLPYVTAGILFPVQWNLCIVVTLGPTFYGCNIEGGCIIEAHNTLAIYTVGPKKVALQERLAAVG